jgi:hypothetical protein
MSAIFFDAHEIGPTLAIDRDNLHVQKTSAALADELVYTPYPKAETSV